MKKLAVIAIGGNSLIKDSKHQTVSDQYREICETTTHIADLITEGYEVVISHGNGPQVGFILRRSEIAAKVAKMHDVPLVNCDADAQGAIGYQIQQALDNEFKKRNIDKVAVTVVTQVIVDKNDKAFLHPSKPIGSFYPEVEAKVMMKNNPRLKFIEDAGRGYRQLVASPKPLEIVEFAAIKTLVSAGFCVIAVGGGGIPVYKNSTGILEGIDAVIDKDFSSSLLAILLQADIFVITTAAEQVCLYYGKPNQTSLNTITINDAKEYVTKGHFAPGSMLPKIKAAIEFLEHGGTEVIITSPELLGDAIKGKAGTHIVTSK